MFIGIIMRLHAHFFAVFIAISFLPLPAMVFAGSDGPPGADHGAEEALPGYKINERIMGNVFDIMTDINTSFPETGVSTHTDPSKRPGEEYSTPAFSEPARGCPPIKTNFFPYLAAVFTISFFVLPTSVTIVFPPDKTFARVSRTSITV